ncbi:MAG: OmpA family protein [Myxococcales bacterium]|nr:OmpA family protein [Myxococcales bacterium]
MPRVVVLTVLCSTAAVAQASGDEWSTFPSLPPAEAAPPTSGPEAVPKPAHAPDAKPAAASEAPAPGKVDPARSRVEERIGAAKRKASEEAKVISSEERYLPGSEPHSPSTTGNAFSAKSNLRVSPGVVGIGLLHVGSADIGRRGLVRFSVTGEYMSLSDFPVLKAQNIRSAGTFAASFVPLEWLETYVGYSASANTNSASSPNLIQALGDITFGAKASRRWAKGLSAGLDLRLLTFSGVGNQGIDRWAVGFSPELVTTYDVREAAQSVPLRLHANLGLALDGTGNLVRNRELNAVEEFALGVNKYNRFSLGLAAEAPLPWVTPFLEYGLALPLGVAGGALVGPDRKRYPVGQVMAQTIGLGLKLTAVKDLTLMAAVDFGLSQRVGLGVPATQPFNFLLGAAFNIDPYQRGETKVVEVTREREVGKPQVEPPKTGKVSGKVVDRATQKPIPGVIVAMAGAGLPPVASDADSGAFLTHELPSGPVRLVAHKDGYKESSHEVMLEAGKTAAVELALESEARRASFEVSVTAKKKPVPASVAFVGPAQHQGAVSGSGEPLKAELPAGRYVVNVTSEGHLAQTREVQVTEGAKMPLAFELVPEPAKKLVVVKENRIEILQQVHFATAKATLMADSHSLLQQVVDAIVKNGIKKIRIEGHTDNRGGKSRNQKLSEDRARSVADYLISQGIDASRVETGGFGDTRPIAPNLTARGRELNRRVEFLILER